MPKTVNIKFNYWHFIAILESIVNVQTDELRLV